MTDTKTTHSSVIKLPSRAAVLPRHFSMRLDVCVTNTGGPTVLAHDTSAGTPVWFSPRAGEMVLVSSPPATHGGVRTALEIAAGTVKHLASNEVVVLAGTIDDEDSLLGWLRQTGVSEDTIATYYRVVHIQRPQDLSEALAVLNQAGVKAAVVVLLDHGAIKVPEEVSRNSVMSSLQQHLQAACHGENQSLVIMESKARYRLADARDKNPVLQPHALAQHDATFAFDVHNDTVLLRKARRPLDIVSN